MTQRRAVYFQYLQLPRNVVVLEGLSQLLVLKVNLLLAHGWILMAIVIDVDHTIAHHLWPTETWELIVTGDDFYVVTQGLPTKGWLQTGVQEEAVGIADFYLGTVANLHGGPSALHIVPVLLEEELR